ncbi:hypothetical protein ACTXG7_16815 [Mycolicibacterium sp. Dal123E01]|uniref:hypothetical protein n=1 Tax=Mycolicibacterium sp. Dal123E01 TaxID=3457578 RepID=UPI00403E7D25
MTSRRLLATAFGVVMAAAAAVGSGRWGLIAVAVAVIAVAAGLYVQRAATAAVLAVICAIALTDPQPALAAAAGVCAAAYLVLMYAAVTRQTAIGITGFAGVGLLATTVPADLPWLPLLAPVAVVFVVGVALSPFLDSSQLDGTGSAATTSAATTSE